MQAIIVNGTLEEIAALVLAAQGQQAGKLSDCVRNIRLHQLPIFFRSIPIREASPR